MKKYTIDYRLIEGILESYYNHKPLEYTIYNIDIHVHIHQDYNMKAMLDILEKLSIKKQKVEITEAELNNLFLLQNENDNERAKAIHTLEKLFNYNQKYEIINKLNLELDDISLEKQNKSNQSKNLIDDKWYIGLNLVKEFKEKYDRFPVYNEIYKGVNIGSWLETNIMFFRRKFRHGDYNRLSENRQEKYHQLLSLDINPYTIQYQDDAICSMLVEYIAKYDKFPDEGEKYNNVRIGYYSALILKYYILGDIPFQTAEKLQRKIDFSKSKDYEWFIKILNIKNYYRMHNNTITLDQQIWLTEELKKLSKRSVKYRLVKNLINEEYSQSIWDNNFELMKEFKEKYNKLPGQRTRYKGISLGKWVENNKNIENEEKLAKLENIGVITCRIEKKQYEEKWLYNFNLLVKLTDENKLTSINPDINLWINDQRKNYKEGKLSDEKIRKLNSIGLLYEEH